MRRATSRAPVETGRSGMFVGTYDARTGIVEGAESVQVRGCLPVAGQDPLQLWRMLQLVRVWHGDVEREQGGCTLQYTVR